jgi:DHA1 family bicyclomycin/chloramphenicol resistance-like MFS transporter
VKTGPIVVFCGFLIAASAISNDSTLPVLPQIVTDLDASYASVQMTITIYILTAGFAQVLWGPLSDGWGRRPVLAAGLAIYLLGCLVATIAPNVETLIGGRVLQGFGGAAALVVGRTILRDLFTGETLARHMATASAVFAAGPIVAPFLGGGFAHFVGWRGVYGVLALLAGLALLYLLQLPETVPARVSGALAPTVMWGRLKRIVGNRQSRHFLMVGTLAMSTMILIIASAPRIYDQMFGLTGLAFAAYFALHGFGIVIGQMANRRLIVTVGTVGAMRIGASVLVATAALFLVSSLTDTANAVSITALMVLYGTSFMVVFSNSAALVLDPHGDIAGFAASIYGLVTQGGAGLSATALVWLLGGGFTAFSVALLTLCALCLLLLTLWPVARAGVRGR